MNDGVIVLNTDNMHAAATDGSLWGNRLASYTQYSAQDMPLCSIAVCGYNRLRKTRYCVECILKYTVGIDYELILVDNGSNDETLEYFKSVTYEKKRIIRVTKNIGFIFAFHYLGAIFSGKYFVLVNNDVYVTKNWLSNLLRCYESDPKIGFAEPVSSNVSNLQQVDIGFRDFDEMQGKAAEYNVSDPLKWERRMRLISLIMIFPRAVVDTVGLFDPAFVHDFAEDDLAVRLRRNGYKLMLCKDTWVCHDHDFRNMEDKDPAAFQASIESGRAIYREKYHGIDAWDDINNFEYALLSPLDAMRLHADGIAALSVDVRCGTPVLEIHNHLRKRGRTDVESCAFTTQAKYFLDLQTTGVNVSCDRIDFIQSYYADGTFDIVALGEPVNTYPVPITLLQRLYNFLKPGGLLLFKLRNTDDYRSFLRVAGLNHAQDPDIPGVMTPEDVAQCLELFGGRSIAISREYDNLNANYKQQILALLKSVNSRATQKDMECLFTRDYIFCVTKG
jgi:GT2 family glycosyltransferase